MAMWMAGTVVSLCALLAQSAQVADTPADEPAADQATPVPATGRMDGRAAPVDPASHGPRLVARVALLPVRAASWLVLKPIEATSGVIERKKLYERAYETLTSDDRLIGLRPSLRYDTGLAVTVGLRYFDRRAMGPGSLLQMSLRAGRGTVYAAADVVPPGDTGLALQVAFDQRDDAVFGGIQGESRSDLEDQGLTVSRYQYTMPSATLAWLRNIGGPFAAEARAGIERRDYDNGVDRRDDDPIFDVYCGVNVRPCTIDPALVPGFEDGLRVVRGQLGLAFDTRSPMRYATGVGGRVLGGYARGVAGDDSETGSLIGELGGIAGFGDHALGARVRTGIVENFADTPIPFDELLTASGPAGVRGLTTGRLRGESILIGTVEYHWLLTPWLDAVLSVDRGGAFAGWYDDLSWNHMLTSFALGLLVVDAKALDYGQAQPQVGMHVAVTPDDGWRFSLALYAW